MTPRTQTRGLVVAAGVLAVFAVLSWAAHTASASETYPPKLQQALETLLKKPICVPQCVACHKTNNGGLGTLNVFGKNLETYGQLGPRNPDSVATKVKAYFDAVAAAQGTGMMPNGDSDGDGVQDETEIANGDSPAVPFPGGQNQFCPDIEYGCAGGRIAPSPPPADRFGLLSAGLVLGFAALRYRRTRVRRGN